MPSGAKKRKAARRKQQAMGTPNPLPDSQSNPTSPQGNGGIHDHDHDQIGQSEGSDHHQTTDEEAEEEKQQGPPGSAVVGSMESSDNSKLEVEVEAEVERTDLAIQTKEEASVQEGEATEVASEEPVAEALVIPVVQSDSMNEEVAQASEAIADSSEIGGDALSHQYEVKAAPLVDATIEKPCNFEGLRTPVTTEVTAAPLVAHRATWWNCCGLLDAITGSQR